MFGTYSSFIDTILCRGYRGEVFKLSGLDYHHFHTLHVRFLFLNFFRWLTATIDMQVAELVLILDFIDRRILMIFFELSISISLLFG